MSKELFESISFQENMKIKFGMWVCPGPGELTITFIVARSSVKVNQFVDAG